MSHNPANHHLADTSMNRTDATAGSEFGRNTHGDRSGHQYSHIPTNDTTHPARDRDFAGYNENNTTGVDRGVSGGIERAIPGATTTTAPGSDPFHGGHHATGAVGGDRVRTDRNTVTGSAPTVHDGHHSHAATGTQYQKFGGGLVGHGVHPIGDGREGSTAIASDPSTSAYMGVPGTLPDRRYNNHASMGDKVIGGLQETAGKLGGQPHLVEKGITRKTEGKAAAEYPHPTV